MESMLIIADGVEIEEFERRLAPVGPSSSDPIVVESGHDVTYLYESPSAGCYINDSIGNVLHEFSDPRFYLLDYRGIELVKKVIMLIADDVRVFVDNDHGAALSGPAFVQKIKDNPAWDWLLPYR